MLSEEPCRARGGTPNALGKMSKAWAEPPQGLHCVRNGKEWLCPAEENLRAHGQQEAWCGRQMGTRTGGQARLRPQVRPQEPGEEVKGACACDMSTAG